MKKLLLVLAIICAVTLIFGHDLFSAGYGLASCLIIIIAANALGFLLKRTDDYYDQ